MTLTGRGGPWDEQENAAAAEDTHKHCCFCCAVFLLIVPRQHTQTAGVHAWPIFGAPTARLESARVRDRVVMQSGPPT